MTAHPWPRWPDVRGRAERTLRAGGAALRELVPTVPAHALERHRHAQAHLVLVQRGSYCSEADGASSARAEPLLVFNPPGTEHADCFAAGQDLNQARFLSLEIDAALWHALDDGLGLPDWSLTWQGPPVDSLASAWRRLLSQDPAPEDDLALQGLCAEWLTPMAQQQARRVQQAPAWLRRAREQLLDHVAAGRSGLPDLLALAQEAGVHPVHLARRFRRHFGRGPAEMVRHARQQHAAALLVGSRLPLTEVALACGYFDQAHLARSLREHWGLAPGAIRARAGRLPI